MDAPWVGSARGRRRLSRSVELCAIYIVVACIWASTMTAVLASDEPDRDEALRAFAGILAPTCSACLVEGRLRYARLISLRQSRSLTLCSLP